MSSNLTQEPDDSYLDGLNYWHEGGSHPVYVALANVTAVAYNQEREDGDLAAAFGFLRAEIDTLVSNQESSRP